MHTGAGAYNAVVSSLHLFSRMRVIICFIKTWMYLSYIAELLFICVQRPEDPHSLLEGRRHEGLGFLAGQQPLFAPHDLP